MKLTDVARSVLALLALVPPAQSQISGPRSMSVDQLAAPNQQVVVLIFAATDCPISNRYIPEVDRIAQEFASHGVALYWVFANPDDTLAVVQQHAQQFQTHAPILIDSAQNLARESEIHVTPEAAVFIRQDGAHQNGQFREVYHGRIDNRYISFGHERPAATVHDLENALQDILQHHPIRQAAGGPIGCALIPRQLASEAKP